MKRIELLQVLLERERKRRDDAQAALRAACRNVETQQEQADGLTTYRVDYKKKWSAQFAQSAQMEILRCYHGFMDRLDQAITQQEAVVGHALRGVESARQRLMEREVRVATVERLIQRRHEQQMRVEDRRDQKNLDEMAQRRSPPREPLGLS